MGKHTISGALADYYVTNDVGVRERRMAFRGDEVELDAAEAERLHRLGVLADGPVEVHAPVREPILPIDPADAGAIGVERPADKASKSAWVAYAVDQGMEPAAAQKLDRDDLVAKYPAPPA